MVITQKELRSRFRGSDFIVGDKSIGHICSGTYDIFPFYENDKTYIISNTDSLVAANLFDNCFLRYFKYTKLMSWYSPETKYYGKIFRMYELQEWR